MDKTKVLFTVTGVVKKNKGRGKELGFPTANIDINKTLPEGIFTGFTYLNERKLPSLIFIGAAETYGETDKKAEVYILDFDQDLYGQKIIIEGLYKIRASRRFETPEELIEQMEDDEIKARKFFANLK